MKISRVILQGAGLIALVMPPAFARQTATNQAPPTIHDRKENQQDRIANGVKSGELTAAETKNLETREAAINKEQRAMRAENGGKLTAADRAKVQRQQNRVSRKIYRKKHNARTQ